MLARASFSILPTVSAPEQRHAADADEERRAHTLLRLLSPLVHRLNNSLAVVQGVHELGPQAREAERDLARAELAVLGQVLARLALLARPRAARAQRVELREVFRTHELLLAPLAAGLGVQLVLRAEGVDTLEVDGSLEPLLLSACSALLAEEPPDRLRLLARASRRGLVLALGTTGPARPRAELAALRALARELGWRERVRVSHGASVLRLTMPVPVGAPATVAPGGGGRARRVLLLHGADAERELVSTLLRENGWNVLVCAVEPRAGAFDLALVERRLALEDPGLPARLRARFALQRVELVEPRMRPGVLLAMLEDRERADPGAPD